MALETSYLQAVQGPQEEGQEMTTPKVSTKKLKPRKKPREFWVLIGRGRTATSVNWGCYTPDSVYKGEDFDPDKGDIILRVREVGGVKVTKVTWPTQQKGDLTK